MGTNVGGTRNALSLADRFGATFNYVSTAYVAGSRNGVIGERLYDPEGTLKAYDRSKVAAEALVFGRGNILRPSTVVGHSATRAVVGSHTGLYGFQRQLALFARALGQRAPERLHRPIRMLVDPGTPLNLVPVDAVVAQMVGIAGCAGTNRIFHVTNSTPPTVRAVLRQVFVLAGLPEPEYVADPALLDDVDRMFAEGISFYRSCLVGAKAFDRDNTDRCLGDSGAGEMVFLDDDIDAYCQWYLDNVPPGSRGVAVTGGADT
jgi:nucleoside-diphosphate-sugar epimerase